MWFNINKSLCKIFDTSPLVKLYKTDINSLYGKYTISITKQPNTDKVKDILYYYNRCHLYAIPDAIHALKVRPGCLQILDGVHRLESAKINDSCNMKLIIHVYDTIEARNMITTVLTNKEFQKTKCIESVVSKMYSHYTKFVSNSKRPKVYNFNKDIIKNIIFDLDLDYSVPDLDVKIFKLLQTTLNDAAKVYTENNNIKTPKKCTKYNFFLMFLPVHIIKSQLKYYN